MTRQLSISIALCTFNGSLFLQEQLESIAQQLRQPDELVICDDGSIDNTISICEAFRRQVDFPVRIQQNSKLLGIAKNYEQAIKLCKSDIIALADQDDYWVADKLACIEEEFSSDRGIDLIFSDAEVVDTDLRSLDYRLWEYLNFKRTEKKRLSSGNGIRVLLKRNVVTGATMAFRSTLRETVLPIPSGWLHDEWIALFSSIYATLQPINRPLLFYRQSPSSQIGAKKDNIFVQVKKAKHRDSQIMRERIEMFESARDKLAAMSYVPNRNLTLKYFNEKISHLTVRYNLPSGFWSRFCVAVREFVSLRYQNYSNGLYSFARDVLL